MENQDSIQRRKYYRLRYLHQDVMPQIQIFGNNYRVSEVSESGIRVVMGGAGIAIGRQMTGVLEMHASGPIEVTGQVLRIMKKVVVFTLSQGPTFKQMVEEQRYMRKHHPTCFPKKSEFS
ncbi:PilZ domain-containing protein [Vibrio sp. PP-XX7]